MKKRTIIAILAVALVIAALGIGVLAADLPFTSLFSNLAANLFGGYTSDEGQILTPDYVSTQQIEVSEGETVWFGPCDPAQYFQLVGQNAAGETVTDKIRGKELTVAADFNNGMVIYQYTVPGGISKLVFSVSSDVAPVYTVSKTEITELKWWAYWDQQEGINAEDYVGKNSYYKVAAGDKLYFGAITEKDALSSELYSRNADFIGNIAAEDLALVESFGGEYGIYCYTVPENTEARYVYVTYDSDYVQYYTCVQNPESQEGIVASFIEEWAIPQPLDSTVETLSGKTALFLGDSITFGARDRANIYGVVDSVNAGAGGWAARIGYYCGMDVTNNGVSGACITTARVESHSQQHYIYNNLVATAGTTYDYVIMHGLFNDASITGLEVGEPQGKAGFKPENADVTTFADALELLFYTAEKQNPDAILGYIVNFHTERAVDQGPFVEMAIQICEDWGIPYLDLYHNDGFSVEFDDGLHPSSAGYDSMYTIVANWMASLDSSAQTAASSATVMSYNVYFGANPADKNASYPTIADRYLKAAQLIDEESADIVLLQECTNAFANVAKDVLSEYSYYGQPHTTTGDESAAIAWKTDKYDLVDSGSIRTDENGIAAEGYPRCINWVVLKDKSTGGELLVMNYHAHPSNESVRNQTAQLVVDKLNALRQDHGGIPAVMGGDLNMAVASEAYNILTAQGLWDIRATVNPKAPGSFNDWTRTDSGKYAMGDYLFMSEGVNASSYQVITDDLDEGRTDGKTVHISDHSPLMAVILY